jgi:hypothetical protein
MLRQQLERIISELKRLTPKERYFLLNFLVNRSGNKSVDLRNFEFDLTLQKFKSATRMLRLFDLMYDLTDEEIAKLAKQLRR